MRELCGFPYTRHDDQVDCLSQALADEPPAYRYYANDKVAQGFARLYSGLAFQQLFKGAHSLKFHVRLLR